MKNVIIVNAATGRVSRAIRAQYYKNSLRNLELRGGRGCTGVIEIYEETNTDGTADEGGGKTSHTIMSGYYKYFSASLANNASARNFLLEANEEDKRSGAGDELQRQREP